MKAENKDELVDFIMNHALPSRALSTDFGLFQVVKTVKGKLLHVQMWGGVVRVGSSVASKDLRTVTGPGLNQPMRRCSASKQPKVLVGAKLHQ